MTKASLCLIYIPYLNSTVPTLASITVQLYSHLVSHGVYKAYLYTSNEVVRLLNNPDSDLESDSDFENRTCHSTEGRWLVNHVKCQSHQAQFTKR